MILHCQNLHIYYAHNTIIICEHAHELTFGKWGAKTEIRWRKQTYYIQVPPCLRFCHCVSEWDIYLIDAHRFEIKLFLINQWKKSPYLQDLLRVVQPNILPKSPFSSAQHRILSHIARNLWILGNRTQSLDIQRDAPGTSAIIHLRLSQWQDEARSLESVKAYAYGEEGVPESSRVLCKKIKHYLRPENKVNENIVLSVVRHKAICKKRNYKNWKSYSPLCHTYKPTIIPIRFRKSGPTYRRQIVDMNK